MKINIKPNYQCASNNVKNSVFRIEENQFTDPEYHFL